MENIGLTDRATIAISDPVTTSITDASGTEDEEAVVSQMCPTQQATTVDKTTPRSPADQSVRDSTLASADIERVTTNETNPSKHLVAAHNDIRVGEDRTEAVAKDNRTIASPSGYGADERQCTLLAQDEPESDTVTEELQETIKEERSGMNESRDASVTDEAVGEDGQDQNPVNLPGADRKM